MANQSSVAVEIDCPTKVAVELRRYIDKNFGEYSIVDEGYDESIDDNNTHITGYASGRWTYTNNLEGYFVPERVKQWLGVGFDYSHLTYLNEEKRKEMQTSSTEGFEAYKALSIALKAHSAKVVIHYKETEGGNCFISEGWADFDGVEFSHSCEEYNYDIPSYMKVFGGTELEAIENLYGDETLEHFYRDKGADASLEMFADWYDNYEGE